ncbi:MAG: hypothetical protein AAFU85_08000 [Planctomycetota bacterium]
MANSSAIKEKEILKAQAQWGDAIVEIGNVYTAGGDVVKCAKKHIKKLYAYKVADQVLFKPTKCEKRQFRPTRKGALSYFVGNDLAPAGFPEDNGFAIAPYLSVKFVEAGFILDKGPRAITMGNYYFEKTDGELVKVEYTFGYIRGSSGLLIDLHHSSLPYVIPTKKCGS